VNAAPLRLDAESVAMLVELRHALGRLAEAGGDAPVTMLRLPSPGPSRDRLLELLGLDSTPGRGRPRLEASAIAGIWRPADAPDRLEVASYPDGPALSGQQIARGLALIDALLAPQLDRIAPHVD